MEKVIPISDLQSKAKKYLATQDEMAYGDWSRRLARAQRESRAGKGTTLDAYVKRRARR